MSTSDAHSNKNSGRGVQSLENNLEHTSPSLSLTLARPEASWHSLDGPTSSKKSTSGLSSKARPDKAPKDVSAIKEQLEKQREKKLAYYGQVAFRNEAEKDAEGSGRLQNLHKARALPSSDLHLLPDTDLSISHNILQVARTADNVEASPGTFINASEGVMVTRDSGHVNGKPTKTAPSKREIAARGGRNTTGEFDEDIHRNDSGPSEGSLSEDTVHGKKMFQAAVDPQQPSPTREDSIAPAAFEWNRRPPFGSDPRDFAKFLSEWVEHVVAITAFHEANSQHHVISEEAISDPDLLPDGLSVVPREEIVFGVDDSHRFGYLRDTFHHADYVLNKFNTKDWDDWGRVEETDPQSAQHKHETAAMLCKNLLAHLAKEQVEKMQRADQARQDAHNSNFAPAVEIPTIVPKTNIYIRPAVISDIPQVLNIFNSHIEHSARTSELEPIPLTEMQNRLADAENESLPFLVAVLKEFKSLKKARARTLNQEKVLGFGAATLFSPVEQAEQYTAELEIYVHREWLRRGIGSCLLDKILETSDPGYVSRQGYFFTCDEASRRRYGPGGIRNLLSTLFIIRHYHEPVGGRATDYDWVKEWLEQFAFREKGYLDQVGMRKGRM